MFLLLTTTISRDERKRKIARDSEYRQGEVEKRKIEGYRRRTKKHAIGRINDQLDGWGGWFGFGDFGEEGIGSISKFWGVDFGVLVGFWGL